MKSSYLIVLSLCLGVLISCGKDNKSGKSNDYTYSGTDPLTGLPYSIGNINSPYSFGGFSVNQVMAENPCIASGGYGGQRIQIQIPLTGFPSVIPAGDVYVGVTSFGDVGAIVGNGQFPLFVAYLCPRTMSGNGQLTGISLGSYSNCAFKPVSAATMVFPDGTQANFRMLDFGSSAGRKFSFCR